MRGEAGEELEAEARWRAVESWREDRAAVRLIMRTSLTCVTALSRFILSQLVVLKVPLLKNGGGSRLDSCSVRIGSGVT